MGAEDSGAQPSIRSLMTDRLGRLGIRSAQILLMITLASVVVFALVQLKLVVLPVLIALILAAAIWPVINGLRRRNVPAVLAAWITFLRVYSSSAASSRSSLSASEPSGMSWRWLHPTVWISYRLS